MVTHALAVARDWALIVLAVQWLLLLLVPLWLGFKIVHLLRRAGRGARPALRRVHAKVDHIGLGIERVMSTVQRPFLVLYGITNGVGKWTRGATAQRTPAHRRQGR